MNTLTDCLKYLNIEGVVPATSPSSPLRGYEQKLTGVDFATPESVPLSDGGGDGFSWGDDMYASESGAESDDSASSIELQPHAPALEQAQQRPPSIGITDEEGAPLRSRRNGPELRRRSSIGRVAYRWGLSAADAAEIVNNFESVQSPDSLPPY